jgi:very-short-patch-repair endonuclease
MVSEGILLIVVLLLAALLIRFLAPAAGVVDHKYRKKPLVSEGELAFLKVLMDAANDEQLVFAKVRVADIVTPARGMNKSEWQKAFNRISSKHVDFLLCRRDSFEVLAAIELDDKSHGRRQTQDRDAFLNQALAGAGMPLIRFRAKAAYDVVTVRHELNVALNPANEQAAGLNQRAGFGANRR